MIRFTAALLAFALSLACSVGAPAPIPPEKVVVLYNSAEPKSENLAKEYAKLREIPAANLVGLKLATSPGLSRVDYNRTLRDPLTRIFDSKKWWTRKQNAAGKLILSTSQVRIIVCMSGVPYRIERTPESIRPEARNRRQYPASPSADEASVDSELCLLGIEDYQIGGPLKNLYYEKDESIVGSNSVPFLVGRVDGPGFPVCSRLIKDAVAVEKTGLWGMCYLDLAKKGAGFEVGDIWIRDVARKTVRAGIPTVLDQNHDTFVTNYPMTEAALYFGWYTTHLNGPFLKPGFRFQRGAVAAHLHSFSASELRNAKKNWCGPLLARGAAATLGNVYEPFLAMTHHFDIFQDRLLKGYTLVEAAYMASPGLSWQGVVLGDPLYRPFPEFTGLEAGDGEHADYKALRTAQMRWGKEPDTLVTKLRTAAARMNSGRLYEALGLRAVHLRSDQVAAAFFESAARTYLKDADKLRQTLHLADLERQAGRKEDAIKRLRGAKSRFAELPEGKAVTALLNILDPPAPPPVKIPPKRK